MNRLDVTHCSDLHASELNHWHPILPSRQLGHGPVGGFMSVVRRLLRRKIDYEIYLDKRNLEGLADESPNIEGMTLSRFDKVLALNRDRINRIYRGLKPQKSEVHCDGAVNGAVNGGLRSEGESS